MNGVTAEKAYRFLILQAGGDLEMYCVVHPVGDASRSAPTQLVALRLFLKPTKQDYLVQIICTE